jgi:hypothetical protein
VRALRRFALDLFLIAVAAVLQIAALPGRWIEDDYANGIYAGLARTFVPIANVVPFTVGDVIFMAIVLGVIAYWIAGWRAGRGAWHARAAALALRTAAVVACILIWFDAAWALNYRRSPIVRRVAFDRARVTPGDVAAFGARIVAELNATAPSAHARHDTEAEMEGALAGAFEPVVRRLGDRYDVIVSRPKTTIFDWWFGMAGIGGQWDPFAYETVLNAQFLPFERPFALAHEWGHVAGFGDESDANLIAALTTMRAKDPFIRYSGLFWAYGFLPDADRRAAHLSPLVKADLAAARRRFFRTYNPRLYSLQWYVYDKYLRANRVTAGVVSYSLFVQVLVGTPLDRDGLPVTRTAPARSTPAARSAAATAAGSAGA